MEEGRAAVIQIIIELEPNIVMKSVTPLILLISVIVIAAVSGCVTKNAADLIFTEDELETLGYNVHETMESDQDELSGYSDMLDGLISIHFIEYRMGDWQIKDEGWIMMNVYIFNNEDNSKKAYLSLSDMEKEVIEGYIELSAEITPDLMLNYTYKEDVLGDQSFCYESNISSNPPFDQPNGYFCVARYIENIIKFRYQCPDRNFGDVKEMMAVFEAKLE